MRKAAWAKAIQTVVSNMTNDPRADPRRMKPGRLVQLFNSTPLGQVLDDRRLRSMRAEAGPRIGDGSTIDLLKFIAWLAACRHIGFPGNTPTGNTPTEDGPGKPGRSPEKQEESATYDRKKERERARNAGQSRSGRDIGPIPPVKDPEQRARALASLAVFGATYFPERYNLKSSPDQLLLREELQRTSEQGGLKAFALPRGSGKTTDCEVSAIFDAVKGVREFIVLLGATAEAADESLDAIRSELESNELLAEDFPEVCYPIQRLEGINNRCRGQLCCGERTRIKWSGRSIILPTVAGSKASGAIIRVSGITGRIRGMKFQRPDGRSARPDKVIGDDLQTDESARSPQQTRKRLKIITGAVLGLAGPGKKIAGIFPITCIEFDDLADQLLDIERHPEFHGLRCRLVNKWPPSEEAKKHWDNYAALFRRDLASGGDGSAATPYVKKHFDVMHEGSEVSWAERMEEGDLSALQHAYNLKIKYPLTFDAEYQNDPPKPASDLVAIVPTPAVLQSRLSKVPFQRVPGECSRITCFIDVQQDILYGGALATSDEFTGSLIDYGTWPDQRRHYFRLSDLTMTLRQAAPGANIDGAILAGLRAFMTKLQETEYKREDGVVLRMAMGLVDAGYKSHLIYQVCREKEFAGLWWPSFGRGIGPNQKPILEYEKKPGETIGLNWMKTRSAKRAQQHVLFDSNWFKSFAFDRFSVAPGDPGAFTLYGSDPLAHPMLIEHLTAETASNLFSESTGRKVTVYSLIPGRDNHLLDVLIGSTVAASINGAVLQSIASVGAPARKRQQMSLAEMAAKANKR